MEDDDDEEDHELLVHSESESNEDAVQDDAKFEDRDPDDLRKGRIADRVGETLNVLARLDIRVCVRVVLLRAVLRVRTLSIRVLLTHRALLRDALLCRLVRLRAVCGVRRQPVAVRVVRETEPLQTCRSPAEGDDLHDEDEEDVEDDYEETDEEGDEEDEDERDAAETRLGETYPGA